MHVVKSFNEAVGMCPGRVCKNDVTGLLYALEAMSLISSTHTPLIRTNIPWRWLQSRPLWSARPRSSLVLACQVIAQLHLGGHATNAVCGW